MPFYIKLIRWYYLFLTFCALLAPLNYSVWQFAPALLLIWMSYIVFKSGCQKGLSLSIKNVIVKDNAGDMSKLFFAFTIGMIVFIPLYVKFYTGGNLATLAMGFYSNVGADSNYQEYQRYFMENNLEQFSIQKLPYIIGYGLTKLLFYFFTFSYVGFSKKLSIGKIVLLVILFLLYSLVGMARGTSFENFELLILLLFATLVRRKVIFKKSFYSRRQIISIFIIIAIVGTAFVVSKSLRSGGGSLEELRGPTDTLTYDSSSIIMSIFPIIGKIALSFSGYFTFGLYFTSELFWRIWINSVNGFLEMLFPFVAPYAERFSSYRLALTADGVDCGACWDPDLAGFSFYLGLPLLFVVIYILGVLSGKAYNKTLINNDVGNCLVLYLIVYEMISLHVGNFLVVSSSNKIMLIMVIVIICFNLFYKYRIRKI